ncbi:hypothetical protein OFM93_30365, partial [Escherichia coli]|nr:hypothetical protein [Escherichia coli]
GYSSFPRQDWDQGAQSKPICYQQKARQPDNPAARFFLASAMHILSQIHDDACPTGGPMTIQEKYRLHLKSLSDELLTLQKPIRIL